MSKLIWDADGERIYETGIDHGVLYPAVRNGKRLTYPKGVVWNGLTAVNETPSGADEQTFYADNIKYISLRGNEDFGGTIECYTYPDEWIVMDGSSQPVAGVTLGQQRRKHFGLSYRTLMGDDVEDAIDADSGYKIHMVWNATASPSERAYSTINDSPEPINFSYEFTTVPTVVTVIPDTRPTSLITVNTRTVDATVLQTLEDTLYGTNGTNPTYTQFTGIDFDPNETYYEQSANGSYVISTDTTPNADDTYYTMTPGANAIESHLPSPDEVLIMLNAA